MYDQTPKYPKVLIFATLFCMGYVASLFLTYSFIVMPGLATIVDDSAFVAAFQGLETRFQNAENQSSAFWNIPATIAFPGAILFALIGSFIYRKKKYGRWILAALFLFIIGMVTTVLYNLPSNVTIFAAGDPNIIDATQVRANFNEVAWLNWNHFRAATTTLAVLFLMRALYLLDRSKNLVNNK